MDKHLQVQGLRRMIRPVLDSLAAMSVTCYMFVILILVSAFKKFKTKIYFGLYYKHILFYKTFIQIIVMLCNYQNMVKKGIK